MYQYLLCDKKIWLNTRSNFVDNKHFCTSPRRNPESFKCNFNGFKRNFLKIGIGAIFAGQAGTITSFIFMRPNGCSADPDVETGNPNLNFDQANFILNSNLIFEHPQNRILPPCTASPTTHIAIDHDGSCYQFLTKFCVIFGVDEKAKEQRTFKEGPWPRQPSTVHKLRTMRTQGQSNQEVCHSKHSRGGCSARFERSFSLSRYDV